MKDILGIFLITYNRDKYLKDTLESAFSAQSPLKSLDFTILDNASTDGTEALCKEYASKYPNIKYIRHNKNIGGNGNIARALATAVKEYVWVICDDDLFDWSAWPPVEEAIKSKNYDLVLTVNKFVKDKQNIAQIFKELTFLPAGIYKTSNITGGVIQNILANIPNMFPHLGAACAVINNKGKIFVPEKEVIPLRGADRTPCETLYLRDKEEAVYVPESIRNMFWAVGYINSAQMIKDKKTRAYILNNCSKSGFFAFIFTRFRDNKRYYKDNFRNMCSVWCCLNFWQKIQFAFALLLIEIVYFHCNFSSGKKTAGK
ncbi:MAG: glycosyltransferase family 2 protein [Endomicrobium sp.]|jgi:glycosyltransferase involved in cell wall biosynthesis|nr:glycosyltransferase family 2 protein [Endomicrobium sp.]